MKDSLIELLCQERINTALQETMNNSERYQQAGEEMEEIFEHIKSVVDDDKQKLMIDDVVSAANARGGEYGDGAYHQGFHDGIRLMVEIYEIVILQNRYSKRSL